MVFAFAEMSNESVNVIFLE